MKSKLLTDLYNLSSRCVDPKLELDIQEFLELVSGFYKLKYSRSIVDPEKRFNTTEMSNANRYLEKICIHIYNSQLDNFSKQVKQGLDMKIKGSWELYQSVVPVTDIMLEIARKRKDTINIMNLHLLVSDIAIKAEDC